MMWMFRLASSCCIDIGVLDVNVGWQQLGIHGHRMSVVVVAILPRSPNFCCRSVLHTQQAILSILTVLLLIASLLRIMEQSLSRPPSFAGSFAGLQPALAPWL